MASTKAKAATTEAAEQVPAAKAKKVVEFRSCGCGCGLMVPRYFAVGHDAKHKGALLRRFDAGDDEAGEVLVGNGWKTPTSLDDRRAKAAKLVEAKAAKLVEKAAKADAKPEVEAVDACSPD